MMAGQQHYLPSFKQGFAASAAESEYPELWRGLAAAWVPELGRTGRVLFDASGRAMHGTFNGATWDVDALGGCIGFGTSQYVSLPGTLPFLTQDYAYTLRFRSTSSSNAQALFSHLYHASAPQRGRLLCYDGSLGRIVMNHAQYSVSSPSGSAPGNRWNHVIAAYTGGNLSILINGNLAAQGIIAATSPYGSQSYLGAVGGASQFFGKIASVLFHSRALSSSEARQLGSDPLAPFRLRRRIYASASRRPCAAYHRVLASVYGVSP
jgi:hypothetical protein